VATAAHQIEGGNRNNDWWNWEHQSTPRIKNGDTSEIATDHWNQVQVDVDLMKKWELNSTASPLNGVELSLPKINLIK